MRYAKIFPFLMLALVIDGFQFLISLALSVVAAVPGTIGGCAVGAYYAGEFGCAALGLLGSIPVVNGVLATATEPIGIALGFAISICISFTLGSILVLFLQIFGILDRKAAVLTYMGETLPGFSVLPAWTALVIRCAIKEVKKDVMDGVVTATSSITQNASVLPTEQVGNTAQASTLNRGVPATPRTEPAQERQSTQRTPPMQDVRVRPTTPNAVAA